MVTAIPDPPSPAGLMLAGVRRANDGTRNEKGETMKSKTTMQWKFLWCIHGKLASDYDGSRWMIGKWREVPAPEYECLGLNAGKNPIHALSFVRGNVLARVECGGVAVHEKRKSTWQRMRVVDARVFDQPAAVKLAVFFARRSLRYSHPCDREILRAAIKAAVSWLKNPSLKTSNAARAAADAAGAVADAAWADAAWADAARAAEDAARAASNAAVAAADAAWAAAARAAADAAWADAAGAAEDAAGGNYLVRKIWPKMKKVQA